MENNISTQPYKGTRDFYPREMFLQNYIFGIMHMTAQQYGYQEYNASILEETAIYRAKSGEEIVNDQTYNFTDRGGREVTIRPEMTPTVARMIAAKRKELVFPVRWYSIPNLFRYERPQRGRLREHWQLNADIFGVDSLDAEVEIISFAYSLMKMFGADDKDFVIKLNNRKLTNYILQDYLGLSEDEAHKTSKLIDKMNKMPAEDFAKSLAEIIADKSAKLLEILQVRNLSELPAEILEQAGVQEIASLIKSLEKLNITNFTYDPTLMRGFDYYTGIVFEVFDLSPENNRSLFGGGRYDDLLNIFGAEPISAVGFGMGDVTITDFLTTHNLVPEYAATTDVKICLVEDNEAVKDFARGIAQNLRDQGLAVVFDTIVKKPAQHIKQAENNAIPFIIFIGEDEMQSNKFVIKDIANHKEIKAKHKNLAEKIFNELN